ALLVSNDDDVRRRQRPAAGWTDRCAHYPRPFRATKGEQPRVLPLAHSDCEREVQVTFLRELVTPTTSASCGKLGELGTPQGFLLSVTFWASDDGASRTF